MANKSISQLTSAAAVSETDLLATAIVDGGSATGYATRKHTVADVGAHVLKQRAYSTTEHVVGKWIDGSTVYEKTIDIGYLLNNAAKSVPHGISNIGVIIEWNGGIITDSGALAPLPYIHVDGLQYSIAVVATSTDVTVTTKSDRTTWYAYITLRYTKTV